MSPSHPNLLRRSSSRPTKSCRNTIKLHDEIFLGPIFDDNISYQDQALALCAAISTDLDSGIMDCSDPRVYVAKSKTYDPDTPTIHEAMNGPDCYKFVTATKMEVLQLLKKRHLETNAS